jgi:hypothetical protein
MVKSEIVHILEYPQSPPCYASSKKFPQFLQNSAFKVPYIAANLHLLLSEDHITLSQLLVFMSHFGGFFVFWDGEGVFFYPKQ